MSDASEIATAQDTRTLRRPDQPKPTFASLAHRTALLRDHVQTTQSDVVNLHRDTQMRALDERTSLVALQEPYELLDVLASEHGLSWTTIARMVGVSDAAVRKWRRGEHVAPENRRRLARGVAFLQILDSVYPVPDIGSWLEMRVSDDATIKAVDIYSEGRADLLFELVGARLSAHHVLDAYDPNWRSMYRVDDRFTVELGVDGVPVVAERRADPSVSSE